MYSASVSASRIPPPPEGTVIGAITATFVAADAGVRADTRLSAGAALAPVAASVSPRPSASAALKTLIGNGKPRTLAQPAWCEFIRPCLNGGWFDHKRAKFIRCTCETSRTMESVAHAIESLDKLADSKPVATLAARFAAEGFELALVGGPVRDAFLGRKVTDLDFATNANPDDIMRLVKPISDVQWDIGRDFGTIAARIDGETVEITTYRADSYDGETRKPVVAFGDSLEKDLERRDFSVNAMALRLPERVLVDPWGGVEHLLSKTITTPGSPEVSFGDDPLRMMRAARFTSQLGFTVSPTTVAAMKQLAPQLDIVSVERVSDELTKLLKTDDPVPGIRLMVETGLADQVLPEIPALKLEVDEHAHHKDVYEHSLTVLRQAIDLEKSRPTIEGPDLILRIAALLHDIGKPS